MSTKKLNRYLQRGAYGLTGEQWATLRYEARKNLAARLAKRH